MAEPHQRVPYRLKESTTAKDIRILYNIVPLVPLSITRQLSKAADCILLKRLALDQYACLCRESDYAFVGLSLTVSHMYLKRECLTMSCDVLLG